MASLQGFDARQVDPAKSFDAIPAGNYVAAIVESEFKPTKKGDGSYLQLTFVIVEGEYRNRKLWARLNLDNRSDEAVGIARAQLSAICRACGVLTPNDSSELHNIPLMIKVKCKKNGETGEIVNEIGGYDKRAAAPIPAAPPYAPPAAQQQPRPAAAASPAAPPALPAVAPWSRPAAPPPAASGPSPVPEPPHVPLPRPEDIPF